MNYAAIKKHDIANGPGVRVSLFVSGCTHHCEGCFNPETWDFQYGTPYTAETELEILEALEPDYIRGLSLLGGEPLEPEHQAEVLRRAESYHFVRLFCREGAALLPLLRRFSRLYPDKTIWCYTGYDFELDLLTGRVGDWSVTQEFLSYLNVLVDGPFVLKEKDITLRFRGSRNQRVIDVPKSLITDQVVWWEDEFGIGIPD